MSISNVYGRMTPMLQPATVQNIVDLFKNQKITGQVIPVTGVGVSGDMEWD